MSRSENPFRPFAAPLTPAIVTPREAIVGQIISRIQSKDGFAFAVLTGGLGVGKSTIATRLLPPKLVHIGFTPTVVPASPRLTAGALLTTVASAMDLTRARLLREFGLAGRKAAVQRVGNVRGSREVQVSQVAATALLDAPSELSAEDVAPLLTAFAKHQQNGLAVILDQAEQLVIGNKTNALAIVEALMRATNSSRVAVVITIRDRSLPDMLPLAGPFPDLMKAIVHVPGFEEAEAQQVLQGGTAHYGVRFSNSLIRRLLDRTVGSDQRIWPVALHAICRQLAERARRERRVVTVRDLASVGDIGGALAEAVESAISVMPKEDRAEAIYLLDVVARMAQTSGAPAIPELLRALPAHSAEDLQRVCDSLVALRLLDLRPSGALAPAHDAVGLAVRVLQSSVPSELDQLVDLWASGRSVRGRVTQDLLRTLAQSARRPAVQVVFLLETSFSVHQTSLDDLRARLLFHLHSKSPQSLIRVLQTKALRQQRPGMASAEELFTLLIDDRTETLRAAIQALTACATRPGAHWDEGSFATALQLARPTRLVSIVKEGVSKEQLPVPVARLLVRHFSRHPRGVDSELLRLLWAASTDLLQPDLIGLAGQVDRRLADEWAIETAGSSNVCVRAMALAELIRLRSDTESVNKAFGDPSALVRRRAVFAIESLSMTESEGVLRAASQDVSPLVREAAMEVAGRRRIRALQDAVTLALRDPFDFVRESAIYAAKDVMAQQSAAKLVAPMVSDESPHVREAAFRLLELAKVPPPATLTLRDVRDGPPSLAAAAITSAGHFITADVEDALLGLIAGDAAPTLLVAAFHAVGRHRRQEAGAVIARQLGHEDAEVVAEAVVALQRLRLNEAVEWLVPLIAHANADVRERVVYALAELGGPFAVRGLHAALWDPRPELTARAIYGLARLRDASAHQLVAMVASDDPEVKRAREYYFRTVGRTRRKRDAGKRR